jgi:hypothetical protein
VLGNLLNSLSLKIDLEQDLRWTHLSRPIFLNQRFKLPEESPPLLQLFQALKTPTKAYYF